VKNIWKSVWRLENDLEKYKKLSKKIKNIVRKLDTCETLSKLQSIIKELDILESSDKILFPANYNSFDNRLEISQFDSVVEEIIVGKSNSELFEDFITLSEKQYYLSYTMAKSIGNYYSYGEYISRMLKLDFEKYRDVYLLTSRYSVTTFVTCYLRHISEKLLKG